VQEAFRLAILKALDETAAEIFEGFKSLPKRAQGATDAELPELFRAIDAQTNRLCGRYGVVLVDYEMGAI
jgi:hypothetical protein